MTSDLTSEERAALEELEWELKAPHTLEAIADRLGISFQAVAETEARALAKMKSVLRKQGREDWATGLREPAIAGQTRAWNIGATDGRNRKGF